MFQGWQVGALLMACFFASSPAATVPAAGGTHPGLVNQWLREQSPAMERWDFGAQFRFRYEVKENGGVTSNRDFMRNLSNDNDWMMFRTKVHLGWTPCDWVSLYAEGRDSTVHSDGRLPSPDRDRFDLYQAYVNLGNPKSFPLTLKVGRQELAYGDERYIGVLDWGNVPRTFDAAKIRLHGGDKWWVDAWAGRVVIPYDRHFNVANDYDWFMGLYASARGLVPKLETDFYFVSRNISAGSPTAITPTLGGPGPRDLYMPGVRVKSLPGAFGPWDFTVELAGQLGTINQAGVRRDLYAFGGGASAGYTFKEMWGSPRLGLGYDFGTGNDHPGDGEVNTFQNMFGTNHKFYGLMDLFGGWNMHIPRANITLKPVKNLTVTSEVLLFFLASDQDLLYNIAGAGRVGNGYGINTGAGRYVGTELDLVATYAPTPWANLQVGYGHFFVGDYIRDTAALVPANGGAVDAHWFYLQAILQF